jgi:hypothetical protein
MAWETSLGALLKPPTLCLVHLPAGPVGHLPQGLGVQLQVGPTAANRVLILEQTYTDLTQATSSSSTGSLVQEGQSNLRGQLNQTEVER